jgi:hypothetical protein
VRAPLAADGPAAACLPADGGGGDDDDELFEAKLPQSRAAKVGGLARL